MARYLADLETRLRDAGFGGRLLMSTSSGGMMDIEDVAAAPIHLINSGPAMAPVAGRHYGQADAGARHDPRRRHRRHELRRQRRPPAA